MNRFHLYSGSILLGLFLLFGKAPSARAQTEEVTFQQFYDELDPYGQWIDDPQYGYVWRPDVGNDFRPYATNGYWTMTDYGNMWVSNYDWGWAPFHYGRWTLNDRYGWLWIPGTEWGPAWVSWRQGGGYYGWAPLGPSININVSFGRNYYAPDPWWCFVPQRYFLSRNFYTYCPPSRRNVTIIHNTTIIQNTYVRNNVRYITGPRVNDIQRVTRQRVNVYQVDRVNRPGVARITNNTVNVYQPRVSRGTTNAGNRPAPANVVRNGERVANAPDRSSAINRGENSSRPQRVDRSATASRPGNVQNSAPIDRTDAAENRSSVERNRPTRPERIMSDRTNSNPNRTAPQNASEAPVQRSRDFERPQRTQQAPSPAVQRPERSMERPQQQQRQSERPQREQQSRPQRVERARRN